MPKSPSIIYGCHEICYSKISSICYFQAGDNLQKKDILLKCPKCNHPSKKHLDNKYCCTRQFCAYEFCCQCCGPFLNNHSCNKSSFNEALPKVFIGSQKSKRNLRRLQPWQCLQFGCNQSSLSYVCTPKYVCTT